MSYAEIACNGKQKLSQKRAWDIAQRMRRKERNPTASAYHCQECGRWHVGSRAPTLRGPRPAYNQVKKSERRYG